MDNPLQKYEQEEEEEDEDDDDDDEEVEEEEEAEEAEEYVHSVPTPNARMYGPGEEMITLYFRDGKRRIDFVLAYEDGDLEKEAVREMFQNNLRKAGLVMEVEDKELSQDGKTYFIKLHAPKKVLKKHAEVLNMKLPIKKRVEREQARLARALSRRKLIPLTRHMYSLPVIEPKPAEGTSIAWPKPAEGTSIAWAEQLKQEEDICSWNGLWRKVMMYFNSADNIFNYDKTLIPDDDDGASDDEEIKKQGQKADQEEGLFSFARRSRIVWEMLMRTHYDEKDRATTGILYLVSNGTYTAAYPLHDGPHGKGTFRPGEEVPNERRLLFSEWSRPFRWYKKQPLGLIRKYFGEKTALYFAWLGFYTSMLVPPSALGLLTMLYGICTMESNVPSQEICNPEGPGKLIMCPLCDQKCDYWYLKEGCLFSRVVHLFDNGATVGFAVFMSLWATLFMELWKRKQATLAWEWNLSDFDQDQELVRPEYESKVNTYRTNPVTMSLEPYLPFWNKVGRTASVFSIILLVLSLVLAAVFGMVVYRIIVVTLLISSDKQMWQQYAKVATSISASIINLLIIIIMDKVYRVLVSKLTNIEQPRTQREYEDSFTFKMFLFEFINMYSSLIYIAFFKGRFFGHPAEPITLFGYRQDQCELGGCLFEVCIQLSIIMVGKQILNNIAEFFTAKIMNWWRSWWREREGPKRKAFTRWEQDYNLQECDRMALFDEYLEMAIQFGFVTLFVAAFPLAPLFALLNNIVEIRLDAYKYVTQLRRPLTARVPNIGAWQTILNGISILAVMSNAFMIAYTSDFIPRLVYMYVYTDNGSLWGYINNSLSVFDVRHFTNETRPDCPTLDNVNVSFCRFQDYREPPESEKKYNLSMKYWHIFAARLSFVVVFEHLVFFITGVVAYLIPDIPRSVQQRIQRQRYLAREALYKAQTRGDKPKKTAIAGMASPDGAAFPM